MFTQSVGESIFKESRTEEHISSLPNAEPIGPNTGNDFSIYPVSRESIRNSYIFFCKHKINDVDTIAGMDVYSSFKDFMESQKIYTLTQETVESLLTRYGFARDSRITFKVFKRLLKHLAGIKQYSTDSPWIPKKEVKIGTVQFDPLDRQNNQSASVASFSKTQIENQFASSVLDKDHWPNDTPNLNPNNDSNRVDDIDFMTNEIEDLLFNDQPFDRNLGPSENFLLKKNDENQLRTSPVSNKFDDPRLLGNPFLNDNPFSTDKTQSTYIRTVISERKTESLNKEMNDPTSELERRNFEQEELFAPVQQFPGEEFIGKNTVDEKASLDSQGMKQMDDIANTHTTTVYRHKWEERVIDVAPPNTDNLGFEKLTHQEKDWVIDQGKPALPVQNLLSSKMNDPFEPSNARYLEPNDVFDPQTDQKLLKSHFRASPSPTNELQTVYPLSLEALKQIPVVFNNHLPPISDQMPISKVSILIEELYRLDNKPNPPASTIARFLQQFDYPLNKNMTLVEFRHLVKQIAGIKQYVPETFYKEPGRTHEVVKPRNQSPSLNLEARQLQHSTAILLGPEQSIPQIQSSRYAIPPGYKPTIYALSDESIRQAKFIFRHFPINTNRGINLEELQTALNEVFRLDNQNPPSITDVVYYLEKFGDDAYQPMSYRHFKRLLKLLTGRTSYTLAASNLFRKVFP